MTYEYDFGIGNLSTLRRFWPAFLLLVISALPVAAQTPNAEIVGLGGKCLDVFEMNPANGTEVVLWSCQDTPNQQWIFDYVGDLGLVQIRGLGNKCLHLDDSAGGTGLREAEIGDCTDSDALWFIGPGFPNNFKIVHLESGLYLDVFMSNTANGTPIVGFPMTGQPNQDWAYRDDAPPNGTCVPSATSLCVQEDRFRVEVDWRDFRGNRGVGTVVPGVRSEDSGLFWFFNPNNWEILIKVLDNCNGSTNRFWVFAAATTNVEYTLRVTDTLTNQTKVYFNPLGRTSPAITDTDAFATCP